MKILSSSPTSLQKAANCLRAGGVVMHPTETCYGIACDLTNRKAVERLFDVKVRPHDKPVSALFVSIDDAKKYTVWTEQAESLARQFYPGPLTVIVRVRPDTLHSLFVMPDLDPQSAYTVGVRISSDVTATTLAQLAAVPLSTTSANLHTGPNPYSLQDILSQFSGKAVQPDIVIDGGVLPVQPPSTIVDCSGDTLKIIRQGDLAIDLMRLRD